MPKKTIIDIKESDKFLRRKLSESKDKLSSDRIKTLLYIKENKFCFQSDIGMDLGRTEKTIRTWIQQYSTSGYRGLLKEKRGGNNTRKISDKALKFLSKISNEISILRDMSFQKEISFDYELSSFKDLKLIIEKNIDEKIQYHALYSHFRRNHKVEFNFLKNYFLEKRKLKKK